MATRRAHAAGADAHSPAPTCLANALVAKQLEILHEVLPAATTIAILDNSADQSSFARLRELKAAALTLGLTLQVLDAGSEDDLVPAFASLVAQRGWPRGRPQSASCAKRCGKMRATATPTMPTQSWRATCEPRGHGASAQCLFDAPPPVAP